MKKSDLARRANRATPKGFGFDAAELFQYGFESGYRAARADMRRDVKLAFKRTGFYSSAADVVLKWLRPIR